MLQLRAPGRGDCARGCMDGPGTIVSASGQSEFAPVTVPCHRRRDSDSDPERPIRVGIEYTVPAA